MSRKPRTDFEGAWHHVGNRGVDRRRIFDDDYDRRTFVAVLADTFAELGTELHAYCLMTNHYHLLTHTPTASLSLSMQILSSRYTVAYNKRHKRDGPLFKSRFWSAILTSDEYVLEASRYINRNSLDLGESGQLRTYSWSSYRPYVGLARCPGWLNTKEILAIGGLTMSQYKEYAEAARPADNYNAASQTAEQAAVLLDEAVAVASRALAGTPYRSLQKTLTLSIATDHGSLTTAALSTAAGLTGSSLRGKVRRFRSRLDNDPQLALITVRADQALKTNIPVSDT